MKYMLMVYADENLLTDSIRSECYVESTKVCHELVAKGQFLATAPLQPTSTATTVRLRDGKRLVTDGPFAETHEQFGGYFLVDVDNLDKAIAIAARLPMSHKGSIEVRPVVELAGLPEV